MMQLLFSFRFLSLSILGLLVSLSLAAILPVNNPHPAESNAGFLESRPNGKTAVDPRAFRIKPGPVYSSSIGAGPHYKDPFTFRIPRTTQAIIFTRWGDELNHDDVISAIEKAEEDLEREVKNRGHDDFIGKIRGWNFDSAHLVIRNDKGSDGVDHRHLLSYLKGLRLFGETYGFWKCEMELFDARYTVNVRGHGTLEVAAPPRVEGVVAEATSGDM